MKVKTTWGYIWDSSRVFSESFGMEVEMWSRVSKSSKYSTTRKEKGWGVTDWLELKIKMASKKKAQGRRKINNVTE